MATIPGATFDCVQDTGPGGYRRSSRFRSTTFPPSAFPCNMCNLHWHRCRAYGHMRARSHISSPLIYLWAILIIHERKKERPWTWERHNRDPGGGRGPSRTGSVRQFYRHFIDGISTGSRRRTDVIRDRRIFFIFYFFLYCPFSSTRPTYIFDAAPIDFVLFHFSHRDGIELTRIRLLLEGERVLLHR